MICPRRRRPSWEPRNGRLPLPHSTRSRGCRPGRSCRPGAVVATGDKAAGADVVLSMAKRANADIVELEGSHVIMISQPQTVTDVILRALRSVG